MGKYFDKRLEQLNGSRLIELGLGDDDGKFVIFLVTLNMEFNIKKKSFKKY